MVMLTALKLYKTRLWYKRALLQLSHNLPYLIKCKKVLLDFLSLGIIALPPEPKLHHPDAGKRVSTKEKELLQTAKVVNSFRFILMVNNKFPIHALDSLYPVLKGYNYMPESWIRFGCDWHATQPIKLWQQFPSSNQIWEWIGEVINVITVKEVFQAKSDLREL